MGLVASRIVEAFFWAALLGVVFTYAGYPLLLAFWARFWPAQIFRAPHMPAVAIIVIAFNEAARIAAKIETCLAQDYPPHCLRVLVVCDGSQDETQNVVEKYPDPRVGVLAFEHRRGKASCVNDAIANCTESILVLTDARQALDRSAIRFLLENFADPSVGAVSGELMFLPDGRRNFGEGMDAYWRYEKFIREHESAIGAVVGVTGALYALRRPLFVPIPAETILDDVLIPMNVVMQGSRVLLDRRAIAWDRVSQQANQERLRKVRTLAGNFQLLAANPALLLPWRNPVFIEFVSHKVLRLLVPLMLFLLLATSALMAIGSAIWAGVFTVQLSCYFLALAGGVWPALARNRLVRLGHTFLVLNGFVVLGFIEFVSNRRAHIWHTQPGPGSKPSGTSSAS
jgi:biofilm PGA synthesis N-glycosyltransferase PgaC